MMGVLQSRWGHLEVLWLNTYVPPKTPRQPFPIPIIFRADPSDFVLTFVQALAEVSL